MKDAPKQAKNNDIARINGAVNRQISNMNPTENTIKRSLSQLETSMMSPMAITNYYNTTVKQEVAIRAAKPADKK